MTIIEEKLYKKIIKSMPIICIDLILIHQNNYLLIKRNQNPLKGEWWVPGGRIFFNESLEEAVNRKLKEEIGIDLNSKPQIYGIYEDTFNDSSFGNHLYHTISIVFKMRIDNIDSISLDLTSNNWKLNKSLPERLIKKMEVVGE